MTDEEIVAPAEETPVEPVADEPTEESAPSTDEVAA